MKRIRFLALLLLSLTQCLEPYAQSIRVSGVVRNEADGERLVGANVYIEKTLKGTTTDANGYFSIFAEPLSTLVISFVGFESQHIKLNAWHRDTTISIMLKPGYLLDEITVKAEKYNKTDIAMVGSVQLNHQLSIFGKPDVIKTLHQQPGISTTGEGSSLILVRGGNAGENAYLIDQAPLIYVNHVGGLVSVFNPDIINHLELYKGNFPPQYGGKLSSILNVTHREGNKSYWKGSAHIGLLDASVSLEGPLGKKSTLIVAGRKSLYDLLMYGFTSVSNLTETKGAFGFYDINTKYSRSISKRTSFHATIYLGDDYFATISKTDPYRPFNKYSYRSRWGNKMAAFNLKHHFKSGIFTENILSLNHYSVRENLFSKQKFNQHTELFESFYRSETFSLFYGSDWSWKMFDNLKISTGLSGSYDMFNPGEFDTSEGESYGSPTIFTNETSIYANAQQEVFGKIKLSVGARATIFTNGNFTDLHAEPRLSLSFLPGKQNQISVAWMRVHQYRHLLFASGNILANEIWIPSDQIVKPAESGQISATWIYHRPDWGFRSELGVYSKNATNLITYKDGLSHLKGSPFYYSKIATGGEGRSKGVEIMLSKKSVRWETNISYTFSKTTRKFSDINQGKIYPFEFDRPHDLNIWVLYDLSPNWKFTANWLYQSGLPFTPIIGRHLGPAENPEILTEILIYGPKNSSRMKDHHRLDIAFVREKIDASGQIRSSWTFGLYNAYNRRNPSYYFYLDDNTVGIVYPNYNGKRPIKPAIWQMSIFPIMPVISFKYNFNLSKPQLNTSKP
ncbi:MAG: TonB-dependent receptor [Bacteroidia bacterium]|nr:TonB-dependent receptor [Bacteroidia bacterium]